ncbi:MAG: family 20 glycosylhydrolase, partial [Candidatus Dormibacteraeota bacterium]|nr:family 20 glycosylhydrolase [Candidatus Dormibacteraeota bacterium]
EGPQTAEVMRARGVDRVEDYQRWFTERIRDHLEGRGRRLVGWDEIIDAGPVPGALVMAWRQARFGVQAAQLGQEVVMAPQEATYFDFASSEEPGEPGALRMGLTGLERVYAFDPTAAMPEALRGAVLGTQFQVWTERIPAPREAEYMSFPRACALAEVAWSPGGGAWDDFQHRLAGAHLPRLDALGVNYRPLDGPRPWQRLTAPAG